MTIDTADIDTTNINTADINTASIETVGPALTDAVPTITLPTQPGPSVVLPALPLPDGPPRLEIDGARRLDAATVAAVQAFVDEIQDRGAPVALLVCTGAPDGADPIREPIREHGPDVALVNKWERALRRLERVGAGLVAVVDGECGGTALEALLTTDHRIAVTGSTLRPASGAGPGPGWPGMALYRMANQVGVARVRRAVLFDAVLTTSAALELGLLDDLAPDRAAAITAALAVTAAADGDVAVRRQLLLEATTTTFEEAMGRHLAACDRTLRRGGS